jgi:methionine-rich copper-binding protein CopC
MSHGIYAVPAARLSRLTAIVAALLLAAAAVLAGAAPAQAHDELLGSDPAAGSTVEGLPDALTLTFSGAIAPDAGASEVQVTDAAGTTLTDGAPTAQDNVLTQPLAAEGLGGEASGAITVLWKVVSSDGHPISGEFSFAVTEAAAPTPAPTASAEPTETAVPTETAEPAPIETAPPAEPAGEDSTLAEAWPWLLFGLIAAAVGGAVVYLLLSRARRERTLAEGPGDAPQPGTEPPADR